MNRREFVQTASFAVAGALSIPTFLKAAQSRTVIGLQLYTLRDVINKDVKGILKKVSDYGYKELETYGYKNGTLFGMKVPDFSAYVKGIGMKVISGHYGMDVVRNDWERAVADAKAIGQPYMVVPWLAEPDRGADAMKKVCEEMNKAGEIAKKHGIRMGYHNHDFEFKEENGKVLYDMMLEELDPELVGMEMDIYWVVYAGHDPLKYFEKYPGRFEQWHVKDMDKDDRKKNDDVGKGSIDFKTIFAKADRKSVV